jgi:hypothetical protein
VANVPSAAGYPGLRNAVERKVGNQYLLNLRGKLKCDCGNKQGNDVLIGYLDRNL